MELEYRLQAWFDPEIRLRPGRPIPLRPIGGNRVIWVRVRLHARQISTVPSLRRDEHNVVVEIVLFQQQILIQREDCIELYEERAYEAIGMLLKLEGRRFEGAIHIGKHARYRCLEVL